MDDVDSWVLEDICLWVNWVVSFFFLIVEGKKLHYGWFL